MAEIFTQNFLAEWRDKDTWTEDEVFAFLTGISPVGASFENVKSRQIFDLRAALWRSGPNPGPKSSRVYPPFDLENVELTRTAVKHYKPLDVIEWTRHRHYPLFPRFPAPIDWPFWLAMPEVEIWEACALSLNLSPDSLQRERNSWMAGSGAGPIFESKSFQSKHIEDQFDKRLRLVTASIMKFSSLSNRSAVNLAEFVAWWPESLGELPVQLASLRAGGSSQQALTEKRPFQEVTEVSGQKTENVASMQAQPVQASAPKDKGLARLQEQEIMRCLVLQVADVKQLPKSPQGTPGPRADVWASVKANTSVFKNKRVFEKAWERLLNFEEIKYADQTTP